jgi:NAD(P)-dependent dehydrogenase (short-subunit alcohol dehydrogenase family)
MDFALTGRRALVTGSSSGLGAATGRMLATEGATVVVHGRDKARTAAVAEEITAAGGHAVIALGDLATDEGADAVAAAALTDGPVDILVNNAGGYRHMAWRDATSEDWIRTYDANVVSAFRMIHRIVPGMRERGWGRVIQIGGGLAIQPMAQHPQYNATLAARHNLAVSLARELAGTGVTSNVVSPGAILVDAVRDFLMEIAPLHGWGQTWPEVERAANESLVKTDVGRLGAPDEIAAAVLYLCGPLAAYVSGAILRVDGGIITSVS